MSDSLVRARIWVKGRVQGVGYRAFVLRAAQGTRLSGGVRNLDDGRVEVDVEGARDALERFIEHLRVGPALARVDDVKVRWEPPAGRQGFEIWG